MCIHMSWSSLGESMSSEAHYVYLCVLELTRWIFVFWSSLCVYMCSGAHYLYLCVLELSMCIYVCILELSMCIYVSWSSYYVYLEVSTVSTRDNAASRHKRTRLHHATQYFKQSTQSNKHQCNQTITLPAQWLISISISGRFAPLTIPSVVFALFTIAWSQKGWTQKLKWTHILIYIL